MKIKDLYIYISGLVKTCPFSADELLSDNGKIINENFNKALTGAIDEIKNNIITISNSTYHYRHLFEKKRLSEPEKSHLLFYYQMDYLMVIVMIEHCFFHKHS